MENVTSKTQTESFDLFLNSADGKKSYRFDSTHQGLEFTLINGQGVEFIVKNGYPCIRITSK